MKKTAMIMLGGVLVLGVSASQVRPDDSPIGTAFTYQGELTEGGIPVDGTACDFEFSLYDEEVGGILVAGPLLRTLTDEELSNGRFTVDLDFGENVFTGKARWLDLAVCCPSPCAVEPLAPRQEVTPTPHAMHALALSGLRTEETGEDTGPNLIGGYATNSVATGVVGATISGGGGAVNPGDGRCDPSGNLCASDDDCPPGETCTPDDEVGRCSEDPGILCESDDDCPGGYCLPSAAENAVMADYATIGGGYGNTAGGEDDGAGRVPRGTGSTVGGGFGNRSLGALSTIGGGVRNRTLDFEDTIGGGTLNVADGAEATVGGGYVNEAIAPYATVSGGGNNRASGRAATIPGGRQNIAGGEYSLAAGRQAQANHDGTFVWADSSDAPFAPTGADQFLIGAAGGVGIGTTTIDSGTMLQVAGGDIKTDNQLVSTAATGTAPVVVSSTTRVSNFNADTVDGSHGCSLIKHTGYGDTGDFETASTATHCGGHPKGCTIRLVSTREECPNADADNGEAFGFYNQNWYATNGGWRVVAMTTTGPSVTTASGVNGDTTPVTILSAGTCTLIDDTATYHSQTTWVVNDSSSVYQCWVYVCD